LSEPRGSSGVIRVRVETTSTATRAGLEALLRDEPAIEIVGASAPADVLLREDLPETSDLIVDLPTVVLTDDIAPQEVLRSGARAALPRSASPAQIAAALQAAAAGLIAMPAENLPALSAAETEPLTPREMEVLEMLAEGLSNKLIAGHLGISEHTAKFHVNSILAKLNAGTRTEAVMRGLRLGLIKI
jgi:DNA-binding NarL/FixJ family response regulator